MDRNRRRTLYLMGLATVGTAVPVGFFVLRGSEDLLSASQTFARYLKTSHPNLYRHLSSRSAAPAQARSAMQ